MSATRCIFLYIPFSLEVHGFLSLFIKNHINLPKCSRKLPLCISFYQRIQTIYLFLAIYIQKQPSIGVLKIYSKFTGEHPCRSVISIKMLVLEICSQFTGEHPCRSVLKSHFGMGVLL